MLGGALKRKEKLSGRFADALSYMFFTSAILKKFEDDGRPRTDLPLVEWSAKYSLYQVQLALDEVLRNFPVKSIGLLVRLIIFPLGLSLRQPNDSLGQRVASILLKPGDARDRLTRGLFISDDASDITGKLEDALQKVLLADPIEKRLRAGQYNKPDLQSFEDWLTTLVADHVISQQEAESLRLSKAATQAIIMVDEFKPGELESDSAAQG